MYGNSESGVLWEKIESNNSCVATRNYQQTITIPASLTTTNTWTLQTITVVEDNWAQQNKTKQSYAQLTTSKYKKTQLNTTTAVSNSTNPFQSFIAFLLSQVK